MSDKELYDHWMDLATGGLGGDLYARGFAQGLMIAASGLKERWQAQEEDMAKESHNEQG